MAAALPVAPPPPAKEVTPPPAAEAAKTFVIPEALSASDDEVQIVIRLHFPTLIVPPVTGVRAAEG